MNAMTRAARRSLRARRGFTAVEVMVAMTLFAIGGAGIIAMERTAVQASQDARALDTGSAIGREWVERIRRDALLWGVPDPSAGNNPILVNDAKLRWLKAPEVVASPAPGPPSAWRVPPLANGVPGARPTFDILGREVDSAAPEVKYCVQYRLEAVQYDQPAPAPITAATTIRVDVRVLWSRQIDNGGVISPSFCSDQVQDATKVQSVIVSSVIRRNNQ